MSVKIGNMVATAAAVAIGLFVYRATSGPIDPPSATIGSTYKTLTEVEPRTAINSTNTPGDADSVFRITTSGSYYLTGILTGSSAKSGIEITAVNVTIDLNGYRLTGVSGSLDAITTSTANLALVVTNGVIQAWGGDGIDATNSDYVRIENVTSYDNTGAGFRVGGKGLISGCNASDNDEHGMLIGGNYIIRGNICDNNGQDGIRITGGSSVLENFCRINGRLVTNSAGIHLTGLGARVQGNSITKAVNSYGINAAGSDDVVVGNFVMNGTGSANSYLFNSTTAGGPIVNVKFDSGSAWTGTTNADNPWANFSY